MAGGIEPLPGAVARPHTVRLRTPTQGRQPEHRNHHLIVRTHQFRVVVDGLNPKPTAGSGGVAKPSSAQTKLARRGDGGLRNQTRGSVAFVFGYDINFVIISSSMETLTSSAKQTGIACGLGSGAEQETRHRHPKSVRHPCVRTTGSLGSWHAGQQLPV